jgi:hypothetical protein
MKTKFFIAVMLVSQSCFASQKFVDFIKACGYGALAGAGLGVLSLAIENKPSEHTGNVARGASLGLYAGIAYGAIHATSPQQPKNYYQEYDPEAKVFIVPKFEQARVDGVEVGSTVYNF